jgi:hypothetical protein
MLKTPSKVFRLEELLSECVGRLPEYSEESAFSGSSKIKTFLFPFDASKRKRQQ